MIQRQWSPEEIASGQRAYMRALEDEIERTMQQLYVSPQRVETAQRVYLEKCQGLVNPALTTLQLLIELHIYDGASFTPEMHLALDLTDTQWIALGAAMAAVAEMNGIVGDDSDRKVAVVSWVPKT